MRSAAVWAVGRSAKWSEAQIRGEVRQCEEREVGDTHNLDKHVGLDDYLVFVREAGNAAAGRAVARRTRVGPAVL